MYWFQKVRLVCVVCVLLLAVSLVFTGCKPPWMRGNDDDENGTGDPTGPTAAVEPTETPLAEGVIISESLKDGVTQGLIDNATFTADGLQLHDGEGFIRYGIPTTSRGFVEFDAKGLETNEYHGGGEFKAVLLTMWDGEQPYLYEVSGYIYELRFFGLVQGRPDASNTLSIRLISYYDWNEGHRHYYTWDPERTYRFRVEWSRGSTTVYVDGEAIATAPIAREFRPDSHQIQIGANMVAPYRHRWKECPHNLMISNVVIGTY